MASVVEPPQLFVAFGLPGAGKTYVARAFEHFGFALHDGDDDLPDAMRAAIAASQPIDDGLRDQFFARIIASTGKLWPENPKLVIAQTFIKEKYRRRFLEQFPAAQFVLVEAALDVRERRLAARTNQALALDYVRKMDLIFEPPQIPHHVLTNNQDGDTHIKAQIAAILGEALPHPPFLRSPSPNSGRGSKDRDV